MYGALKAFLSFSLVTPPTTKQIQFSAHCLWNYKSRAHIRPWAQSLQLLIRDHGQLVVPVERGWMEPLCNMQQGQMQQKRVIFFFFANRLAISSTSKDLLPPREITLAKTVWRQRSCILSMYILGTKEKVIKTQPRLFIASSLGLGLVWWTLTVLCVSSVKQ